MYQVDAGNACARSLTGSGGRKRCNCGNGVQEIPAIHPDLL
jgi:hypothetical protein